MSETGNAKNIEHFAMMVSFCDGYGATVYKPTNAMIELAALQTALADAQTSMDNVATKLAAWKNSVAGRENEYKGIRPLTTRILAAYEACGADKNKVDNIRTLHRRIHGARAKALPPDDPGTPEDESKGGSVSHQSYVQIAEAFSEMIQQLSADALYVPNETALQITTLQTKLAAMEAANAGVIAKNTDLSNARVDRNKKLYDKTTGICELAAKVKTYVKSLFGQTSAEYKQISGLRFTTPR